MTWLQIQVVVFGFPFSLKHRWRYLFSLLASGLDSGAHYLISFRRGWWYVCSLFPQVHIVVFCLLFFGLVWASPRPPRPRSSRAPAPQCGPSCQEFPNLAEAIFIMENMASSHAGIAGCHRCVVLAVNLLCVPVVSKQEGAPSSEPHLLAAGTVRNDDLFDVSIEGSLP